MARRIRTPLGSITALATGLALTACTNGGNPDNPLRNIVQAGGDLSLVAFDSCPSTLRGLKAAAAPLVGPYGFSRRGEEFAGGEDRNGGEGRADAAPEAPAKDRALPAAPTDAPKDHSTTNVHEAGVDEPDLVKTDGKRIVVFLDGILRVVDPETREVTGELRLLDENTGAGKEGSLLLHGDRVLVVMPDARAVPPTERPAEPARPEQDTPTRIFGTRLVLVDLAGPPQVLGRMSIEGAYLDGRQVGSVARVVTRSGPKLPFVYPDGQRTVETSRLANQRVFDRSTIDQWLPRYQLEQGGSVQTGHVDCTQVRHPVTYSGTSLLTVLTFDLGTGALTNGEPVTIAADGNTVYGSGTSLYIANDLRYAASRRGAGARTELYKFDTAQPGRPRYVAAGAVPGWLLNQYSMSEHAGHLRVATTSEATGRANSSSTVFVLTQRGGRLAETGRVGGLGRGERIYAVRFLGPIGYVVTFRQVDPLYTLDLRDPSKPRVVGELKITGYSAYLHPVDEARLLGVGQEATTEGRRLGTQVSLFDVRNLANPGRLAQYHVRHGQSEVEFDPHAFLYWARTGIVVIPVLAPEQGSKVAAGSGALVLKVGETSLTALGFVEHPTDRAGDGRVRRSLVVGDTLWTVSSGGLRATDATTAAGQDWVAFS